MGAPPLPPVLVTLDALASRGPLYVAREGQVAHLTTPDGVECWTRVWVRDGNGAHQYEFKALQRPEDLAKTPGQLVEAAIERAAPPRFIEPVFPQVTKRRGHLGLLAAPGLDVEIMVEAVI